MKKVILGLSLMAVCCLNLLNARTSQVEVSSIEWNYTKGGYVFDHQVNMNIFHCPSSEATNACRYPAQTK